MGLHLTVNGLKAKLEATALRHCQTALCSRVNGKNPSSLRASVSFQTVKSMMGSGMRVSLKDLGSRFGLMVVDTKAIGFRANLSVKVSRPIRMVVQSEVSGKAASS